MGSERTHRPQDLGATELCLSVCPSPTLSSFPCTIASGSCIFDSFLFFPKPFQAPAHTASIPFPPAIPTGAGIFGGKRLTQQSGTIQLLLVNTELLHWQLLPARQHMHWNKEKPRQHRRFIKAWFPAKPLQLGRGHGARHFRAALPRARQQQTHAQPWPCWQLVPISLLGQISPRCWGWKRVLQSPAPDSTSGVWGLGYLLGSLSAGQGVFLERFPSAVHLSQAQGVCSAA